MFKLMTLVAASTLALASVAAQAMEPMASAPMTKQQSKMGDCATSNKGKKGDEYKTAMKSCLADKPMTQQEKMSACSKTNKGKKGDEYKASMKTCLAA